MQELAIPQGEDLTGAVGRAVVRNALGEAVLPQTGPAGAQPSGIVTTAPADANTGTLVGVTPAGPVNVTSAAPFTDGDRLTFDPDGRLRVAATGAYVLAHAQGDATAADETHPARIVHEGLSGFPLDAEGVPTFAAKGPHSSDGRPIVLSAQFRGDVHVVYPGRADDVAAGVRFGGAAFVDKAIAAGDQAAIEWGFIEWLYITGGFVSWINAAPGDWFDFRVVAPATVGVANAGAGAFNLAPSGLPGVNIWAPAPLVDGSHDIDLDEKLNANVGFTKAVPVPSTTTTGFFDWNPDTNDLTLNAGQTGGYHLFDVEIPIRRFCAEVPIVRAEGERDLRTAGVKAKRLLPHWRHRVVIHDDTFDAAKPLTVCWDFLAGRAVGA